MDVLIVEDDPALGDVLAVHLAAEGWRLLLELSEARLRVPGQPISAESLIAAGWPGQSLLPTAAQNRLHVAVNALRKLGLRRLIVTRDDGYLLTPSIRVRWVVSS